MLLAGLTFAAAPAPAAAPKVPDVIVGPASAETSTRVEAPIAEVTVYSDRARVRRRGRVTVGAAVGVVRLPDLPGAAFLDTVRVAAVGARVIRVEATPIERERLEIEQATRLLDALDGVGDRLAAVEDRARADEWEVATLTRLSPASPVPEDKREGRKGLTIDVSSWWKALDFLGARTAAGRARLVRIADERRQLEAERDRLRADVAQLNQGGFSDRSVQVIVALEPTAGGPIDLELEYFVPGAHWKPAYTLLFSSARGQVTLETTAVVGQTSGEDWTRAALAFSTAIPGRGIDLPELLTWTLGERSEFVPVLHARIPPRVEPLLPMPAAQSLASEAHAVAVELVRDRLARAARAPAPGEVSISSGNTSAVWDEALRVRDKREIHDLVASVSADEPLTKQRPAASKGTPESSEEIERPDGEMVSARPAAAPAPEMAMEQDLSESGAGWRDVVAAPRRTAMLGKSSSSVASAARVWPVSLSLFDATAARRPPRFVDPYLPAVSAGGLDFVYRAPTPTTVESSGKEVRVPLASQTFRADAFYEATPALATTAFLRARVRNDGKRPLLLGPATIFGDGEFVGVGEIRTTGPGGEIELPLGADQDIRLVRQIVPSGKTTGLILKSQETVYDVQLQVGNYKKQAVTVEVIDQLPVSRNDDVDVKLLATNPAPAKAPDTDGVIRWRVSIPPGETRTLKLSYQITRPKDWKLYQR